MFVFIWMTSVPGWEVPSVTQWCTVHDGGRKEKIWWKKRWFFIAVPSSACPHTPSRMVPLQPAFHMALRSTGNQLRPLHASIRIFLILCFIEHYQLFKLCYMTSSIQQYQQRSPFHLHPRHCGKSGECNSSCTLWVLDSWVAAGVRQWWTNALPG